MKILIALGVGIALGLSFKKPEKPKEPKFIVVDDRNCLGEHLFGPEGKEAFKKFLKPTNRICELLVTTMQLNTESLSEAKQKQEAISLPFPYENEIDNRSRVQVLEEIRARFPHAFPSETPFDKNL